VTTSYIYDVDAQRAYRSTADLSVQEFTIHDGAGRLLAELDGITGQLDAVWKRDSIYLGSRLLATRRPGGLPGVIEYAHTDTLGSVRATTDQSGAELARHDYAAFGEDLGPGPAMGPERQRFTGKERDSETFFDYYGARYYRNVIGRFTTADNSTGSGGPLPYATLTNPQSINLYAYAGNNPLRYTDPTGHCFVGPDCAVEVSVAGLVAQGIVAVTVAKIVIDNREAINRNAVEATQFIVQAAGELASGAGSVSRAEELRGGEPAQLKAGKEAHNAEEVRPGEQAEVRTPSGKGRMDRYDADKAHIREIKPNNHRGIKAGQHSLDRYKLEMDKAKNRSHTTELTLYPKGGGS
jgi:RHS repeat-associated protein